MRDAILPTNSTLGSCRGARGRSERIYDFPTLLPRPTWVRIDFFFLDPSLTEMALTPSVIGEETASQGGSGQSVVKWRLRSRGMSARWKVCVAGTVLTVRGCLFGRGIAPPLAMTACLT